MGVEIFDLPHRNHVMCTGNRLCYFMDEEISSDASKFSRHTKLVKSKDKTKARAFNSSVSMHWLGS